MTFYYLDEDQSDLISTEGRQLGLDITTTLECGRGQADDESQLRYAASQSRCIVTKNYDDFSDLTARFMEHGWSHAGVALVQRWVKRRHSRAVALALLHLHRLYPGGLPADTVVWLEVSRFLKQDDEPAATE